AVPALAGRGRRRRRGPAAGIAGGGRVAGRDGAGERRGAPDGVLRAAAAAPAAIPPPYMGMGFATIGIVGLGLMGGSLALALRQARPELTVIGCARDPLAARRAMDRGAVAIAGTDLDAVRAADLIVLAVPVL